jgi:hypothetical protein
VASNPAVASKEDVMIDLNATERELLTRLVRQLQEDLLDSLEGDLPPTFAEVICKNLKDNQELIEKLDHDYKWPARKLS